MLTALGLIVSLLSGAGAGDRGPLPPDSSADPDAPPAGNIVELDKAAMNAAPFAAAAQAEGISVDAQEIKQRAGSYAKLYAGQEVDSGRVRDIMLAEKYLEAKGVRPDEAGLDTVPGSEGNAARFAASGEAEFAAKTLGLHRMLDREDVRRKAEELETQARVRLASGQKPPAMRPVSELQLQGDPEECLAWAGRSCLLSLQEYNAAATYYPMPGSMHVDSARVIILKRYLHEKRLAEDARDSGWDQKADSAMQRIRDRKRDFLWTQSTQAFGMQVQDMRSLQSAYGKYYGRYFAPGEDATFAIIGSSDSVYIDSLYRVYQSWYRGSALGRKPGGNPAKEPVLPWAYFKEGQLPKDLIARADSLKAGQCGFPYRSPYGYFLVRLEKSVPTPEVSFESAFLRLVFLATRDKYLEMDSVVEARAKDYYAANIAQFARPDTLELRAWLIPRQGTRSSGMTRHDVKPRVLSDTACYQALEIPSLALPAEVRVPLQERVRKDAAQAFFGPLSNRFGRWYFQVRSRKPAHGVLPFRLARKDILDRMTALPEEEGSGTASDEAQEEVGFNLALAQAYRQVQDRKRMEKEGQERHPEGGADLSHPDGRSDSKTADAGEPPSARIRREEAKRRADEDRMLKEARVDLNRLFR